MLKQLPNGDWIDPSFVYLVGAYVKDYSGRPNAPVVIVYYHLGRRAHSLELICKDWAEAVAKRDEVVRALFGTDTSAVEATTEPLTVDVKPCNWCGQVHVGVRCPSVDPKEYE